jgi:hypothetical protein
MTNVAENTYLSERTPSTNLLHASPASASAWRGILLVEPDITLLNAEASLLTRSNYLVTPAFGQREVSALRRTKAIALGILSDHLGPKILGSVAQAVRKQWPLARILIVGRAESVLEDHLYDEQTEHSADPIQILHDIETLYKGSWNQYSNTLYWNGKGSGTCMDRSQICESDPTKAVPAGMTSERALRGTPSGIEHRPR